MLQHAGKVHSHDFFEIKRGANLNGPRVAPQDRYMYLVTRLILMMSQYGPTNDNVLLQNESLLRGLLGGALDQAYSMS